MAKVTQPDLRRAGAGNHASDSQHTLPLGAVGLRGWTAAALGRVQGIAILAPKPKCTGPVAIRSHLPLPSVGYKATQ